MPGQKCSKKWKNLAPLCMQKLGESCGEVWALGRAEMQKSFFFGANEPVWHEDGQTSQAKRKLKVVVIGNCWCIRMFPFRVHLVWWHVWDWLQGSSCKCFQQTLSPGGCAKIFGRSRASVTGEGKFEGTKSRVAGCIAHWKRVQVELKDAVLQCAIDSTKASFSIWMSICFWLICRGGRDRFDFRVQFLQRFFSVQFCLQLLSSLLLHQFVASQSKFHFSWCFGCINKAKASIPKCTSAHVRQKSCGKRARSRRLQMLIWRSQFMDTMYQDVSCRNYVYVGCMTSGV